MSNLFRTWEHRPPAPEGESARIPPPPTRTVGKALHEFHKAMDALPGAPPAPTGADLARLRRDLMREELDEVMAVLAFLDRTALAKELADLVYVTVGTAEAYGIPFDAVFAEVHRSNMSKLANGAGFREDGKLLKGDTYTPPDLTEAMNA